MRKARLRVGSHWHAAAILSSIALAVWNDCAMHECTIKYKSLQFWEVAERPTGGQMYHAILGGGGGRNALSSAPFKPDFGGLRIGIGLVSAHFRFLQDRVWTMGGGTYHRRRGRGGGPKPLLGRGLMLCLPLPEFPQTLCRQGIARNFCRGDRFPYRSQRNIAVRDASDLRSQGDRASWGLRKLRFFRER